MRGDPQLQLDRREEFPVEKPAVTIVDVADERTDALSWFENEAKCNIEALPRPHLMHHTASHRPSLRVVRVPRRKRDRWNSTNPALAGGLALFACGIVVGAMLGRPSAPPATPLEAAPHERLARVPSTPAATPPVEWLEARRTAGSDVARAVDAGAARGVKALPAHPSRSAVRPHRGTLIVTSIPRGAAVFLNDVYAGETPLTMRQVASGSRAVRVALDGYARWSRGVQIVADDATIVSARLNEVNRAQ